MAAELADTSVRSVVKAFLLQFVDDPALLEQHKLITDGLLDSLVAVQMIDYLQQQFEITVLDEDLEIDNFDTLDAVQEFVERKRAAGG